MWILTKNPSVNRIFYETFMKVFMKQESPGSHRGGFIWEMNLDELGKYHAGCQLKTARRISSGSSTP